MAHEVERMVFVGQLPWHGLGTEITGATSFDEAFALAGLDWQVDLEPLFLADGRRSTHCATVRSTDKRILGVVGPGWRPLQNRDAFGVFQPLIDAGDLSLHTAGSLRHGARVWVLCRVNTPQAEIVPGDPVESYALLSMGHDGKMAVRIGFTPVRVVCANTMAAAIGCEESQLIRVRHSMSVLRNCERLRDVMDLSTRQFQATADQFRFLASRAISRDDLKRYVQIVYRIDDAPKPAKAKLLASILDQFETGRGQDLPGVRGTWWAAYNAVTHHSSHYAGRSQSTRLNSLWFGQNAQLIESALETALEMAS